VSRSNALTGLKTRLEYHQGHETCRDPDRLVPAPTADIRHFNRVEGWPVSSSRLNIGRGYLRLLVIILPAWIIGVTWDREAVDTFASYIDSRKSVLFAEDRYGKLLNDPLYSDLAEARYRESIDWPAFDRRWDVPSRSAAPKDRVVTRALHQLVISSDRIEGSKDDLAEYLGVLVFGLIGFLVVPFGVLFLGRFLVREWSPVLRKIASWFVGGFRND
jgi:hypothetical protein